MLSDRSYAYSEAPYGREWWKTATMAILAVNLGVYILQMINDVYLHFPTHKYLALSTVGLSHGYIWQLITFQLLHAGHLHFLFNAIAIFLFGRYTEETLAPNGFWNLIFSAVWRRASPSLLGFLFPQNFGIPVMGASAGICGLIAIFAIMEPDRRIYLYFFLPVPAKYFLYFSVGVAVFFILVPCEPGVAHGAHLGGLLTGVAYVLFFVRKERSLFDWRPYGRIARERELVEAHAKKGPIWKKSSAVNVDELPSSEFISKEVDPILDKISAHGIHSLTSRERQILEAARKKMK